ncbi:uncharacterized protein rnf215 isoform X4 [Dicentrarchus labrax]|uniref:uncharacterized protein rnf215 isoform X4 n=1 Tax=Dicentrarchus labrax TaxID=13489 RepID=UPI0021F64E27|nr:uncharacterized protein rnf215 isoform X4 [Dicentrarchus labrax]
MVSVRCWCCLWVMLPVLLLLVAAEQVARVEVFLEQRPGVSALLQGEVVESSKGSKSSEHRDEDRQELEGELVLVQDQETQESGGKDEDNAKEQEVWIGVVPVEMDDSKASTGNQESFADAMVNKMKRALVLGASALIILALNQNSVSEMDLSQVLSKPIIVIQTSENVTKLIGALLRMKKKKSFPVNNSGINTTNFRQNVPCSPSHNPLVHESHYRIKTTCKRTVALIWFTVIRLVCKHSDGGSLFALNGSSLSLSLQGSSSHSKNHIQDDSSGQPGSHAHAVVQLRSIERRSLRRVAGGHLHGRDQLSGPVPAAAVGHRPPGGSDPQHWSHRSGSLAVPGPPAQ